MADNGFSNILITLMKKPRFHGAKSAECIALWSVTLTPTNSKVIVSLRRDFINRRE